MVLCVDINENDSMTCEWKKAGVFFMNNVILLCTFEMTKKTFFCEIIMKLLTF